MHISFAVSNFTFALKKYTIYLPTQKNNDNLRDKTMTESL